MRLGTGIVAAMLARHLSGAASGSGHTETVQATRPNAATGIRPYLRAAALAAVAMGGLAMNASVSPASAAEGPRSAVMRLVQGGTNSPPIVLLQQGQMDRWAVGNQVLATDIREGSSTFGEGTESAEERARRVQHFGTSASGMEWSVGEAQVGLALSADASSDPVMICRIVLGGSAVALSAADKTSLFAQIRGPEPGQRITARLTDWQFDNFTAAHELGHCLDQSYKESRVRVLRGEPNSLGVQSYARYRSEARADAYATLWMAAAEGHTRTGETVADLRIVGTFLSGTPAAPGKVINSSSSGDVISSNGADYLTTPAIDAAVAEARRLGTEGLRALSPQDMRDLAERVAASVELSASDFVRVSNAISDTRMRDGRVVFSPDVPRDLSARYDRGVQMTGFALHESDFYGADAIPANRGMRGAEPGPLAAPGMERVRTALAEDLRQAKEVLSATRGRDGAVTVRFRELGGGSGMLIGGSDEAPVTTVIVARDGSVTRLNSDGLLSSRSETRPARVLGGVVTHALPDRDGLPVLMGAEEGRAKMEYTSPVDPAAPTMENLGVLRGPGEERGILRRALLDDLTAGATPVRVDARQGGRSWRVTFREVDGSATSAVVREDGAVARFGANGRQMSIDLDPMRPAARTAEGIARHVLVEAGAPRVVDEQEMTALYDARAAMRAAAAAAFEDGGGAVTPSEPATRSFPSR